MPAYLDLAHECSLMIPMIQDSSIMVGLSTHNVQGSCELEITSQPIVIGNTKQKK